MSANPFYQIQDPRFFRLRELSGLDGCVGVIELKRISRGPEKFEIIRIADTHARSRGVSLQDETLDQQLLDELTTYLREARSNEILIHGMHVQSMFAHVAGALGRCIAIKEEDAGHIFATDSELLPPDFRVVTANEYEFLVEVKNCHAANPERRFRLKNEYLERLSRYARVFTKDLKIAIFWSRFGAWTLLSPRAFSAEGANQSITFPDAMKRNEMATLGDCMIGTRVPLAIRFLTDPEKPRTVGPDGRAECTIKSVELYCAERRIDDRVEQNIAWFLMLNGRWPGEECPAEIARGELISFRFELKPESETPGQGFEIIGNLSQMVSRQYTSLTAPKGCIAHLAPDRDPDSLGVIIPPDFKGDALPLWRFVISPNYS